MPCCAAVLATRTAGIKQMFARRELFHIDGVSYVQHQLFLPSGFVQYFLDRADAIRASDYEPTEQGMLRIQVRSTSLVEGEFQVRLEKKEKQEKRKMVKNMESATFCM
jgi:hypothetical protein